MGRSFAGSDLLGQGGALRGPSRGFSVQSREVLGLGFAQLIQSFTTDAGQLPPQSIPLGSNRELALVSLYKFLL